MDVFLHGRIIILKSELLKPGAIALWRFQSTLWTPLTAKQRCVQFDNSPTTNSHQTRLFTKNKWRLLISSRRLFHPAILSSTATTRYSCFFFHCFLCLGHLLLLPWSPDTCALFTCYLWWQGLHLEHLHNQWNPQPWVHKIPGDPSLKHSIRLKWHPSKVFHVGLWWTNCLGEN